MKYNPKSSIAEEFINDEEIIKTIEFAKQNKDNATLQNSLLEKAANYLGLSHQEAAVLLYSEIDGINEKIFEIARDVKEKFYGSRIVIFAPLYLSNFCINSCVYCPYHIQNKEIARKKLTQEEIAKEVVALQDMGHKRLALEIGEDPENNPIEYVIESIKNIYSIKHKNGAIRRVNVNIAATTVEEYKMLKDAEIGTYILFQETYNKKKYEMLHPAGPKSDYAWHTEAMDRAMDGGIDDVGIGVLFGLENYQYEFIAMLMHAEHLEAAKGVGPHTISVPRVRPADDINPEDFKDAVTDDVFERVIALLRISVPYTGMIISTRESKEFRERALNLGISQLSGGSKTSVGGYVEEQDCLTDEDTSQFEISDNRTLEEVVSWLAETGHIPSFCTACYREGRTGDRFMSLVKSGQIANCCQPNALITFKEYLEDYANDEVKEKGNKLISSELNKVPSEKVREKVEKYFESISKGIRDFRF